MIFLREFDNSDNDIGNVRVMLEEEFITFAKSVFAENEDWVELNEPKTVDECVNYIENYCENFEIISPFAISISDGHEEDWYFYDTKEEVEESFENFKKIESDIHVYGLNSDYEYEVINSYWDEDKD